MNVSHPDSCQKQRSFFLMRYGKPAAIQNALLTVLNEKIYLNGNQELKLPIKGIIAASNELPAKNEGLEALWDRFLLRYVVNPIEQKQNFFRLLSAQTSESTTEEFGH